MKIWILTSEIPDRAAGGIARYVENFSIAASKEGHQITIFTKSLESKEEFLNDKIKIIHIAPKSSFPYDILSFWDAFSFQLANEVIKNLENDTPDIIEVQDYEAIGYYLIQRKLTQNILKNTPIVVHLHSPWFLTAKYNEEPLYRLPYYWIGRMERFCIAAADSLIAPSRFIGECVKEEIGKDLKIDFFPLPGFLENIDINFDVLKKRVVYFGRLEVRKGVLKLLKACKKLWDEGEDFELVLIGSDTDYFPMGMSVKRFIKDKYRNYLNRQLIIKNDMRKDELLKEISKAWMVVIPSLWENFPNTCIEAMSVGEVVLASKNGGQREIIEDKISGFIFDWNKDGDFEEKLKYILSLSINERYKIAKAAKKRIKDLCNPEKVIKRRIEHFQKLINDNVSKKNFPISYKILEKNVSFTKYPQEKGLLSVVIPFYNMKDYIKDTLASIFSSTYKNLEVIVVNDGSNKENRLFLQNIQKEFDIRIINQENRGLFAARNRGAKEAKGEFLAFVDSDDIVDKTFFEKSISILNRYENVSFVYSWIEYFGDISGVWPTYNAEFPYLLAHNMVNANLVVRYDHFINWGMNKKEMKYSLEDYESWISILEKGGVGVSLPEILVKYRVRENSMYRGALRDQILYLYEQIVSLHPKLYREYGKELFLLQNENSSAYQFIHPSKSVFGELSWREYELGAKIVKKIKGNFLVKAMLKNPKIKDFIKKTVKKFM